MRIDLNNVDVNERVTEHEAVSVHDAAGNEREIPCDVTAITRRVGDTYYIDASIRAVLELECDRCLTTTRVTLEPACHLVVKRGGGEKSDIDDDDFVWLPANEHEFDLSQYIYEAVVTDLPMVVACAEDCKGLCSRCGVNLNKNSCKCEAEVDPRWNELKKLADKNTA